MFVVGLWIGVVDSTQAPILARHHHHRLPSLEVGLLHPLEDGGPPDDIDSQMVFIYIKIHLLPNTSYLVIVHNPPLKKGFQIRVYASCCC